MANDEHHRKLIVEGVEVWNNWRKEVSNLKPDLERADFSGANLTGADLSEANLVRADLTSAKLSRADLRGANLTNADLSGASLSKTVIDESTKYQKIKGCQIGLNGFMIKGGGSAAIIKFMPPGTAIQGGNPEAIIESLKRARRLHGFSMSLSGLFILIAILGLEEIKFQEIQITPLNYGLLAMPISIGLISLVNLFMEDSLKSARFLNSRNSVAIVGNFPWVLCKYAGETWISYFQSILARFIMAFHPLIYFSYWEYWGKWSGLSGTLFGAFVIVLSALGTWTFILSQGFQRPIFFDTDEDDEFKYMITKILTSVEDHTSKVTNLIHHLEQKTRR